MPEITTADEFKAVVTEHWRSLYHFGFRMCLDRQRASEMVEETLGMIDGLILTGVPDIWQYIIKGLVLVGAVGLDVASRERAS